jgi:hypothetical protein
MPDGVNVDFGLLKTPDYVGDYANAFQAGRDLAQQRGQASAAGNAFGPRRMVVGDFKEQLAGLGPDARARLAQQADLLGGIGMGLKSVPYPERRPVLAHMTPALATRGVNPGQIAAFDPTDANLDEAIAQARQLTGLLAPPPAAD